MPILKVKNKETGQWEQVGVSTEATGAQIAAHNASPDAHADIRQLIVDLHGANEAMAAAIADQGQSKIFYATIGTNWTEDEITGVKSQSIAIDGVLASHTAKMDHVYNGDGSAESYTTFVEEETQFLNYITNGFAKTYDGGITIYIFDAANTVNIPVIVEVS
jgi:hypothetical protein